MLCVSSSCAVMALTGDTHLSFTSPPVDSAAVHSKVVVLLLLIYCSSVLVPLFVGEFVLDPCFVMQCFFLVVNHFS